MVRILAHIILVFLITACATGHQVNLPHKTQVEQENGEDCDPVAGYNYFWGD